MLKAGQMFAHFKIVKRLGEGGMGQVFLAEDTKLTRNVAIKILTDNVFEDSERQDRFLREARTAARISHPNVMAIYDIGTAELPDSGKAIDYIVMEEVNGNPLNEYIRSNSPSMADLIRIAEKIAAGLSAAHKMSIVHRDIKSDNILVDAQGNPKILDFGLAKPVSPLQVDGQTDSTETISQELTRAGKILGTVKYMSPEQVQGKAVDNRSDIFSFGILLYGMCTGEQPFEGETQVSTMAKILETSHESPRLKNASISPELERIIDKCLQKKADDRYQDTRDLVVDLRNLRRQHDSGVTGAISTITDKPSAVTKALESKVSLKKVGLIAAGVIVVGAIALGFGGFFSSSESESLELNESLLAVAGFVNKTGNSEFDWMTTGLPEILLTDLSQSDKLQLVSQQKLVDCLPIEQRANITYEQCIEAAKSLGAGRILSGSLYMLGDKIRIDARLEDLSTGRIIMGEKVIGTDAFILVDSLVAKIAKSLDLGAVRAVTTATLSTPEAFKQYHLGMEKLWANEYDSAVAKFEEALMIDSTFALPYMRIAMAKVFSGRQAEGRPYLQKAVQYQEKLPIKERGILDVYADFWLRQNFDHGFEKAKTMLRNYPEDGEMRTIYAILAQSFQNDTIVAFAQLDTVLMSYPNFPFALEQVANLHSNLGEFAEATKYIERLEKVLPDVSMPKSRLARLYQIQGRRDDAWRIYEKLVADFPDEIGPLYRLINLAIYKRDFKQAKSFVEEIKNRKPDDLYTMIEYYGVLSKLALWRGDFSKSLDYDFKRLDIAFDTKDSQRIYFAYSTISTMYLRFEDDDSALYYAKQGHEWANMFSKMGYYLTMVRVDAASEAVAREPFERAIADFRSRLPRQLWPISDALKEIFEGSIARDTARIINANRSLVESQDQKASGNVYTLGQMLVAFGEYEEGKELLERFLSGRYESTSGWVYPTSLYWTGVAEEGLGNSKVAIERYQEFLKLWSKADHDLKEIKDARKRLGKLTS